MENGTFGAPKLNGLILTGGRSTRMGRDKSQLIYHGKPQREHLTELLAPYCEAVFWSVNTEQAVELPTTDQPLIIDLFDFPGPLNGILSAFTHDSAAAWLVVACDMPLLTTRSLDALLRGRNLAKLATVFYDSDGQFPEPLLGIYEPAFHPVLKQAMIAEQYSPRQALQQHDVQILTVPDIRELANVNDPATKALLGL
ncbi:molybdenum cofactor guanylyltransferase [Spirosoma radiotolerans]|uniref:Probable molybdenum cofactor guanylyltransferase n=1 Tax=Spirosoma radiotolerans TaxID=1379870 RepID=A0A0E3V7L5_9BACT|nr:molybdenum cofactor guanylyltransferase [Spirosoma radiotolerans]AKD55987.1 molybdenum cofactor biosynthesis protein MoaC [Spirosoma radiotolerans]